MFVVDASVWVSMLVPKDETHRRSRKWVQETVNEGIVFVEPSLLLIEIAAAISRRTRRSDLGLRAVRQIGAIPNIRFVYLDESATRAASEFAATFRLRGADAIYASLAYTLAIPLITWDTEQLDRAADVVAARFPD